MLTESFWNQTVDKFYRPEAERIVEAAEKGKIGLVAARPGSGKSRLFTRAVESICAARGIVSTTKFYREIDEPQPRFYADCEIVEKPTLCIDYFVDRERRAELRPLVEQSRWLYYIDEVQIDQQNFGFIVPTRQSLQAEGREAYFLFTLVRQTEAQYGDDFKKFLQICKENKLDVETAELPTYLPAEYIGEALAGINISTRLIDFICSDVGQPLRHPRFLGNIFSEPEDSARSIRISNSPHTIEELTEMIIRPGVLELVFERSYGGPTRPVISMLEVLGIFKENPSAKKAVSDLFDPQFDRLSVERKLDYAQLMIRTMIAKLGLVKDPGAVVQYCE